MKLTVLGGAMLGSGVQFAQAGMTVFTLTDLAEARLHSISFFCLVYLLLALGVMWLWNYLARSFQWMPRINFWRSLSLMLVSGLFLYVILTMISGARELLTPGAWEKQGVRHKLSSTEVLPDEATRKAALQELKGKLWSYAEKHGGKLPHSIFDQSFETHHWVLPKVAGYYSYLPAPTVGGGRKVIVYEPSVMGRKRFVLLADGSIEAWEESALRKVL